MELRHALSVAASILLGAVSLQPAFADKKDCNEKYKTCGRSCDIGLSYGTISDAGHLRCYERCAKAQDACLLRETEKFPAAVVDPGPRGRKPRGKPGVATVPPVGGGLLDPGPRLGTQGPAATGSPVGGSAAPTARPGRIN